MVDHWAEDYSLCDIAPAPCGDGIVDVQDLISLSESLFEGLNDLMLAAHWALDEAEGDIALDSVSEKNGFSNGYIIGDPLLSETTITDGQWHCIGFLWDGSYRTLYLDSIVVAQDIQDRLESSSKGLYIGTRNAMQPGTYFSGLIDDVHIYNRSVRP